MISTATEAISTDGTQVVFDGSLNPTMNLISGGGGCAGSAATPAGYDNEYTNNNAFENVSLVADAGGTAGYSSTITAGVNQHTAIVIIKKQ